MDKTPLKDKRIEVRVTAKQKAAIEQAARIEGRTITDFSVTALAEKAHDVIQRDRQLRVDAVFFDEFTLIMDRPAQSVSGLSKLLKHKTVFVD